MEFREQGDSSLEALIRSLNFILIVHSHYKQARPLGKWGWREWQRGSGWRWSHVLRLDEPWVWAVKEEVNQMRDTAWQVPSAFEEGSLSFPGQLGYGELAPAFKALGLSESMAPTRELSKVLQGIN